MIKRFFILLIILILYGCDQKIVKDDKLEIKNIDIANFAKKHDKQKSVPKGFLNDCSGFVRMVYSNFNIDLFDVEHNTKASGTEIIFKFVEKNGAIYPKYIYFNKSTPKNKKYVPQVGDIIFFDNTHDKNRDKKVNDFFTHVAIVLSIDDDNTINYIHKSSRGINTQLMNLDEPNSLYINKKRVNSYLRVKKKGDSKNTPYLSGELFRAFGTLKTK